MILFVGNLLLSKGAGILLEACALLRARGLSFRCHLIGEGKDANWLRQRAQRADLAGVVHLEGSRPQRQLADWYRAADLVTLPSYSEGLPNVLREALACGRPFVATAVGGIPELAGPYSQLVPPGDAPALAEALAAMLADPPVVEPPVSQRFNISWDESARLVADCLRAAVRSRTGGEASSAKRSHLSPVVGLPSAGAAPTTP